MKPAAFKDPGAARDDGGGGGDERPEAIGARVGRGCDARGREKPLALREEEKMMHDFFRSCLRPAMFLSLPSNDPSGSIVPAFVQIVAIEPKSITFDAYTLEEEKRVGACMVHAQVYERWALVSFDVCALGLSAELFLFSEEPVEMDAMACARKADDRDNIRVWTAQESDVAGCLHLCKPSVLRPPTSVNLFDASMPLLCLLDHLRVAGYTGVAGLLEHIATSNKRYDTRHLSGKKNYLKCLIISSDLFAAGVPSFSSNRSAAWYGYLLRFKTLPPDFKKAAELQKLVKDAEDGFTVPAALSGSATEPRLHRMELDPDISGDAPPHAGADDEISDDEICEVDESVVAVAEGHGGPPVDIAGDVAIPADEWPNKLEDVKVKRVGGKHTDGWHYYDRLAVNCPNPHHEACSKSRSIELMTGTFGREAPSYSWAHGFSVRP